MAERLFDLIDEEPHVEEVADGHEILIKIHSFLLWLLKREYQ